MLHFCERSEAGTLWVIPLINKTASALCASLIFASEAKQSYYVLIRLLRRIRSSQIFESEAKQPRSCKALSIGVLWTDLKCIAPQGRKITAMGEAHRKQRVEMIKP